MKKKILFLLLLSPMACAFAKPMNITILVDAASLKKTHPDEIMLDGKVYADIDNDHIQDVIKYSYSASTPPVACGQNKNCIVQNNDLGSQPILTFDIFLNGPSASIPVSDTCTNIGVVESIHNGMKNIFCGPSFVLQWNGEDYVIAK